MTDRLHQDFETRSEVDLAEVGLYNYATHPTTEVLMLAWALNQSKVRLWVPHREPEMPRELRELLEDPWVEKHAWNAPFERAIYRHVLKMDIPVAEWHDPSVIARYISLPGKLSEAGEILGLKEEAKLAEGKDLIKLFCEPVAIGGKPSLFGVTQTVWNDWQTHPADWETFKGYGSQDVVAERAILKKVEKMAPPPSERRAWELDQCINGRGMPVDMELVAGATKVADIERALLAARLLELTGLENPNSVPQMLGWAREHGYPFNALGKVFVARALKGEGEVTPECREALLLRQQASKSSVHKLEALRLLVSPDGRVRDQFVFYGAATLRWGSRGVQLQNLPRPTKEVEKNMPRAIELLRAGDHTTIAAEFSSPLDVVTSCLRPMFRAPAGKKFVVSDLNAIENRMLGWLARSPAILRVFEQGLDPYKDFAMELYNKPYDEITKEERNSSKPAVLGCFAADTPVLTQRGWVPIVDVRKTDKLWDGVEWVEHEGCVAQGRKFVLPFHGLHVTPDHKIFIKDRQWKSVWELILKARYERVAFDAGLDAYATSDCALTSTKAEAAPSHSQTDVVETYDLLNVGPRNRFLVLSDTGCLLAHNCGYQLGGGEVTTDDNGDEIKTGLLGYADGYGVSMTPEEAARAVAVFRAKYPEVKQYWYDLEEAAIASVRNPGHDFPVGQVTFRTTGTKVLRILLPSGRALHYIQPKVERLTITHQGNTFEKDSLTYMGKDQQTKQWVRKPSRGGHLTENLCQALARDVLVDGMMQAEARGFPVVGHVHDELIALPAIDSGLTHEDLSDCMRVTPAWAGAGSNDAGASWPALPLNAEGYEDDHYRKG